MASTPRIPVVKLVIWCLVIGLLLAMFNATPERVYAWAGETGQAIFEWFYGVGQSLGPYILMGAMLVLPVWGFFYIIKWFKSR